MQTAANGLPAPPPGYLVASPCRPDSVRGVTVNMYGNFRWGYQNRQPAQEFHRRHHAMGAASARRLQQVRDAAVLQLLDALEREGRPRAIADESLSALVIAGGDAHCAVNVEAVVRRRKAPLLAVQVVVRAVVLRDEGPAEEGAAREREARERVDGRVRGWLVAAVLRRALVEVAVAAQPGEGAIVDAPRDVGDVGLRRRRRLVDAHALAVLLEDGVDGQVVELRLPPNLCRKETAPVAAPTTPARRLVTRSTSSAKMRPRAVRTSGLVAARPRSSKGRLRSR
jgi:hypothetical protein